MLLEIVELITKTGKNMFSGGSDSKRNLPAMQETQGWEDWVGKILWRREWLFTPVFWPGELHGQKSLEVYSSRGHKESDTSR